FPIAIKLGIEIDPLELLPLWNREYLEYRKTPEADAWPLAQAWDTYMAEMIAHRNSIRASGDMSTTNPQFHAWRERQINRGASELGCSSDAIVHPVIAYELSQGCSIGCWFCGISARSFEGNYNYTKQNASLWQGVLQGSKQVFGDAARTGFCYWATDPCDNPDYDKFIYDHYSIIGTLPQTTTAGPMKNISLTKRIMALHQKHMSLPNRFSVLSVRMLDKIHNEFTADELMFTELVVQTKEAIQAKAIAGRAMEKQKKFDQAGSGKSVSNINADHSTIACVSGFLVNMVAKTVQLVAPTRACEAWPKGYRVYDTHHFSTAREYTEALTNLINTHMPNSIPAHSKLSFRHDLDYAAVSGGYKLATDNVTYSCNLYPFMETLGNMIHRGEMTGGQILSELVSDGEDVFAVSSAMQNLFDLGLLDDDPAFAGLVHSKTTVTT
ncbi:MAG: radical SAM family RiPP maturation amino acid epimerase, partial [Gammaproteobacteria bacterium]|nr:radical SAM family RiPP maturation amino acid epimerase [Gammaproteobacteria bacterium]